MRMHADQLQIKVSTVRRLIDDQFPQWQHQSVEVIATDGTVNAIFRIGSDLSARFPLRGDDPVETRAMLEVEADRCKELASSSPIATPEPVALGNPGHGYPLPWTVQTWLPGQVTSATALADSIGFAGDLAAFIRALRQTDTHGRQFSGKGRGGSLQSQDE